MRRDAEIPLNTLPESDMEGLKETSRIGLWRFERDH
jgi:hypothetical protein